MQAKTVLSFALAVAALSGAACEKKSTRPPPRKPLPPASVDAARIIHADNEPGNWMTHGRTYSEQRFSPLTQINDQNVRWLGLVWSLDLDTHRGQEATPLVVDGVMYFSTAWSKVLAVKAATGEKLWSYDPKVPPEWAINACCDVVNRGVAAWQGKIFLATLDGRLIALDAATGKVVWEALTIDRQYRYTITGAPRVVKGRVLIGNAGSELGVRGYISAYDADTGKLQWRFYTVPGDPAQPFENSAVANAAKTWTGSWWKLGGGGTVWDSMAYDPELDLLYIGTGNGTPWSEHARSPQGGDNLYTSSIIALQPDTGVYVWHYQETPGDVWDFDSAAQMILANLVIDNVPRKVLLHAPKSGFFYVLDRATGQLISAKPYTTVSWADGIDLQTGRPIEHAGARYKEGDPGIPLAPGPSGGHTWHSMSFSPMTGLVYLPVLEGGFLYKPEEHFQARALAYNTAIDFVAAGLPQKPEIKQAVLASVKGRLAAWNPVQQKEVWRVELASPVNGGVLSTAGNLVFQGTAQGNLEAYRAATGEKLWSADAQSGIVAAPIAYSVNDEQFIAVVAGWGGVFPLAAGEVALKSARPQNIYRVLAFKIGGKASLPALPQSAPAKLHPPRATASAATVQGGEALYQRYCSTCHGDVAVSGGVLPDLRYSATLGSSQQWSEVVLSGSLQSFGMVSFSKELSPKDVDAIRAYVIARANQK